MAKIVRFHQIAGPEVLKIEEGPSRELSQVPDLTQRREVYASPLQAGTVEQ